MSAEPVTIGDAIQSIVTADQPPALAPFEGKQVLAATIAIRNAGDGLSKAMSVDPVELHLGQRGTIVLEYEVDKIRFEPVKDTEALERVHVLKAGRATFIDATVVAEALDEQEKRIEAANGVQQLPFDGAPDEDREPDPEMDELADIAAGDA